MQNNRLGGIIFGALFCGFSVLALYHEHGRMPTQWLAAFVLVFIWGIWMIISGLFKADTEGAMSYFVGSIVTAIFAVIMLLFALLQKAGWSGIPFIPDAWNQIIARLVVALGGVLLAIASVAFFKKAVRKRRKG